MRRRQRMNPNLEPSQLNHKFRLGAAPLMTSRAGASGSSRSSSFRSRPRSRAFY